MTTAVAPVAPSLLDRHLPEHHFTVAEHRIVDADVARTWAAVLTLDLLQVHTPLLDAAIWARGLPERLAAALGRTPPASPSPVTLRLGADVQLEGWVGLGTIPHHEIAFGSIGRFWEPTITWHQVATTEEYDTFDEPGWGRIAASLSLRPYGRRTLLTYEARTAVPDVESQRRFARYWLLVRPFVRHIMRATLAAAADAAAEDLGPGPHLPIP